ncbi:hypothetical protein A6A06_15305 [Streptomyces sp. CB02923]|uniref:hypothetical protein n=1 Tax=Streptomyces sp. CB02923 TaxID=1718985 RepID=UPI000939B4DC|nr:hypothetical protein [Streptomyces sp. CB02923]OKI02407.1 hypothetical protein A6A06_15305 [Streptomyces sp. CB02923]
MSSWTGVSKLSLTLESGDDNCNIYANGWNRIGVTITVEPTDDDGDSIDIDSRYLAGKLWLIDYVNESTLTWKGSSGWSYTDTANEFTAIPDGPGARTEAMAESDGTRHVTFYVYCSPGVNRKSIGVRVQTDSGDTFTSSQDGDFQSKVTLSPRAAVTYMRGDIDWNYSRATTQESGNTKYVTTSAWNYYLSLKAADNYFVTFRAHGHCSDSGYDGFFAWDITPDNHRANFYGGYVWYREPHTPGTGEIVNFPEGNHWWDYADVYDRSNPERYLCFTWVHSTTGGNGWHIPNSGPLNAWQGYDTPKIVAWDRYGNTGTFWVDGNDITRELKIFDRQP